MILAVFIKYYQLKFSIHFPVVYKNCPFFALAQILSYQSSFYIIILFSINLNFITINKLTLQNRTFVRIIKLLIIREVFKLKIINPGMPEPYKYETDYRKIPKKYLNSNIPEGRKMIKWAPFATMPQQYETINQYIKDQSKTDKPILDELALRDLNDVLAQKLFYDPPATIKYWDNGYYKEIACEINKFDSEKNVLEVIKEDEKLRLNMDCIVGIE